jgi:tungstate transport system ATP-binding protein
MKPVYSLTQLQKIYANRTVVDIDSLDIEPGEILVIVGPSGAGKSSLLRMLNFLEYPERGQLFFQGRPVTPALPIEARRQVTTVFQRPALLHDSVENNIRYGLRLRGQAESRGRVNAVIERMGLSALRRAQARTLSGGEAQRVALARAMVLEPAVLLMDEPTANLDPYHVGLIEEVAREINNQGNTTIVLVTHNVFQAHRLADRVALMLNGRMIEIAPAQIFFENPADPRTRAFVRGEMIY